mmetsp:Transcript_20839/g.51687  ORF Transcript_20839/g.51687 Transcript_20839/m.51687 type:complete len:553 (+) Transcript_20839:122-1780(+)
MAPKKRSPDDVHDIFNVKVGKPYRGSIVEKIDIETTNLDSGKVKVRRLIHMDGGIILIEDTWHEHGEVFEDGKLLPYDQIKFPSMNPADFVAPARKKDKDDEDEKQRKRDLLRQKAKDMLNKNRSPANNTNNVSDSDDDDDDDNDDDDFDELRIKVKTLDGEICPVVMKPGDTVDDLKGKLENDHFIPMDDNGLSLNGKPLDKPKATMKDCGVKDGDILDLEPNDNSFTVSVRTPDGQEYNVNVKPTDTVQDLKEIIENDHDIPVDDQKLSCCDEPLDDPASTMADNDISDGDVIDLKTNDISVNIRSPDGNSFPILIKPDGTVKDLKKAICYFNGMPVKDQKLDFEGKRLKNPSATMNDLGVSDGDTIDLDPSSTDDNESRKKPSKTSDRCSSDSTPKAKDKTRVLSPDSAWVYPTKASAPREGEKNNLQGVWSTPPAKGSGTDPVEVNIHPKRKEPKSDGRSDIHGAYGYVNGAKPDADGVVDPANVVFYPPGHKKYSPDFEHIGWWSAPESSSKTTVSWRFEGNDCLNVKKHTVNVMGHEMTFVTEWVE